MRSCSALSGLTLALARLGNQPLERKLFGSSDFRLTTISILILYGHGKNR